MLCEPATDIVTTECEPVKGVPGRVLLILSPAQLLIPLEALRMKAEFTQMFLCSCVVSGVPRAIKQKRGGE